LTSAVTGFAGIRQEIKCLADSVLSHNCLDSLWVLFIIEYMHLDVSILPCGRSFDAEAIWADHWACSVRVK